MYLRIFEELQIEDLPDNFKMVAERCGMDIVKNLMINVPSLAIYIPRVQSLQNLVDRYILKRIKELPKNIDITNQLAVEIGISQRTIRRIINKLIRTKKLTKL